LRSLRGEVIENEEEIVKNPITGELRYRQISSAPVRNAEGIIIGSVSVVRDVTEHKKAEKEIESLAKFPNENPAAVLRVEQKGTILFANPQAQLFLKEWQTKVGESVPEHVRQAIVSSLASGTRTEFEETLGEQTFSFLTAPIATAGYANLYGRNITKRKKAEAKLEEYTKHLEELVKERTEKLESSVKYTRSLIEASLDPLVTISVDGKITDVNKATEEATGYTRQELVGSDFSEYFTEPEKARTGYTKVFTDSFVIDYPLALKHKNGKVTDVLYNATVYRNENGEIQGVFAAARDVTERKKAEEQLKNYQEHLEQLVAERTEKLKRNEWIARERARELEKMQVQLEEKSVEVEEYANNMESLAEERLAKLKDAEHLAAIGATAGMVGHDIRNPLQAIVGDLYLISTDAASLHESEIKESIEESVSSIYKNVDYINKIIQDLQDYSRQLAPTKEIVDLEELCKEVVSKGGIPKNITVSCHITQATKRIVSDSNLLTRILSNLFSNAVQAMSKGGKLKIEAYRQAGDTVVTVEDTGGGIPEDVRPKLFTPLFTTKSKGQGFGLPVVKRMTEALDGSVTYESEVGKGTKFFVRLPPQKEPAKTNTISN
jgi:PAS domain S-box-containing protein